MPARLRQAAPSATEEFAMTPMTTRALTGNGIRARIELDGQSYTLRITRAGKLILTK